ncbi:MULTISPECIES: hypothetical protein [Calothrix]|uniref:Bacteriocin n=2 Tax=Calothrix TaxID=1186 RepID=A0ABR8A742_9CYAN|nr:MULTISPECIES: hypothetical protein [Calothrix]MBD2195098.1 hypothetical protein [Calothrix parietina FACHB-288]MBD2223696.1 hypothetical protein [Calothrix anomala FACHB-343]
MNVDTKRLPEMNMEMRKNNLTTANQNSKIANLLDNLSEQELELVVGGTDNLTTSITINIFLEGDKPEIPQKAWNNGNGGGSGGSGGGGSGGSGGW